jgi:aspartyl protease family protein
MNRAYSLIVGVVAVLVVSRGLPSAPEAPTPSHKSASTKPQTRAEIVLPRDDNGHFFVDAEINGTRVRMLADTGASVIALGEDVAESIGLDPDGLNYDESVSTANGAAEAAFVELDEVRVGSIVRRDVKAVVTRGLRGALLGMSFFNTLSKVSMESNELVLKD